MDSIEKIYFFDFDKTLFFTPEADEGKKEWEKYYGIDYPHIGWWSKPESLDSNVFSIQSISSVTKIMKQAMTCPKSYVVVLSARLNKLYNEIKDVLDTNGLQPDVIDLKSKELSKSERVKKYLDDFPNLNEIHLFDDNFEREITDYIEFKKRFGEEYDIHIQYIDNGNIKKID